MQFLVLIPEMPLDFGYEAPNWSYGRVRKKVLVSILILIIFITQPKIFPYLNNAHIRNQHEILHQAVCFLYNSRKILLSSLMVTFHYT